MNNKKFILGLGPSVSKMGGNGCLLAHKCPLHGAMACNMSQQRFIPIPLMSH